ncbi:Sulfatase [gamma proteobacterium HdN1]|nr:Sulfatase [gamma proteobacterium HdN1]
MPHSCGWHIDMFVPENLHSVAFDQITTHASPNIMLFRRTDYFLLIGVLLPILAYCAWTKWAVVSAITPLSGFALMDFLRQQIGYFGLIMLWSVFILGASQWLWLPRAFVLAVAGYLAFADLIDSATIFNTGALSPYYINHYAAKAVGLISASTSTFARLNFIALPLLMLASATLIGLRWYFRSCDYRRTQHYAFASILLLAWVFVPPLAGATDRNLARPSYIYHLETFIERNLFNNTHLVSANKASDAQARAGSHETRAQESQEKPNLVVIVLESVSAQATSLYNPHHTGLTPYLESLAAQGWMAKQAYTVVPHTSKALTAINCGKQPNPRFPIYASLFGSPAPCLADILNERGYTTAYFQSPVSTFENRAALVKQLGFETFFRGENMDTTGYQLANYFGYEDNIMLQPSKDWLKQQTGPFFAFYLTGTTHHPYWVPTDFETHTWDASDKEHNDYLNAVHYLDQFVENLLKTYKEAGFYENTVFAIIGDHGESFGLLHPRMQHNVNLYQEVMQIPMLIHAPGKKLPIKQTELVSQTDFMPSILDLLGVDATKLEAAEQIDGRSVFSGHFSRSHALSYCWYENWCSAAADGRYKYIQNYDERPEELYDLRNDPAETTNIASQHPQLVEVMRAKTNQDLILQQWDAWLSAKDPDFQQRRDDTIGPVTRLLKLPEDDPRHMLRMEAEPAENTQTKNGS